MNTTLLIIQHVDHEGPDLIGRLAEEHGLAIQTLRPDRGDEFPSPSDCPKYLAVVLGGPMGVNDRHIRGLNWLQKELEWLTCWHQAEKPVIGICLGAQLLALAAGGTVEPLLVGEPPQPLKEVGLGAIHWLVDPSEEPLLDGLDPTALVLHWHGDRIRLPNDATLLGSSLHCPEQVFKIDRHAVGLQCHLEISEPNLERWIQADAAYIVSAMGRNGADKLRHDWKRLGGNLQKSGTQLFTNVFKQLQNINSH